MSLSTSCTFFPNNDSDLVKWYIQSNAYKFQNTETMVGLSDLPKVVSVSSLEEKQNALRDKFPFRIRVCKRSMLKCCGSCTNACRERCIQDIYTKLSMYVCSVCAKPIAQNIHNCNLLAQSVYKLLIDPSATYDQLLDMCNQLISIRRNTSMGTNIKELTPNLMDRRNMNPWRLNYAPEPEMIYDYEKNTSKPVVDKATGLIKFRHWPETGMCPFCVPRTVVLRGRKVQKQ